MEWGKEYLGQRKSVWRGITVTALWGNGKWQCTVCILESVSPTWVCIQLCWNTFKQEMQCKLDRTTPHHKNTPIQLQRISHISMCEWRQTRRSWLILTWIWAKRKQAQNRTHRMIQLTWSSEPAKPKWLSIHLNKIIIAIKTVALKACWVCGQIGNQYDDRVSQGVFMSLIHLWLGFSG